MTKVNFYDNIDDSMLKFAVIIARHNGKWVFCKHKERNTWEVPGGHRAANEDIIDTAKREGRIEANIETAQRLLAMGLPAEQVAKATQLPLDKVQNLSN